ncbi:Spherulation-specific family 4 [Aspergillus pseudoustus]|uniref:Spherulation-specific family 4 n=1 Tax=Aspergillus pseudoustus TaxID=1810923 RepID=A0ABR4K6C0_9EURO
MPSLTHYLSLAGLAVNYYASLASATGVILPLYTWPSDSTWEPVYSALAAYPDVDFYVIVNPNSGPGTSSPPASDYVTGVETLNSYANAHTLGYVRVNWANRDIGEVKTDIDIYSQWASYDSATSSSSRKKRSPCNHEGENSYTGNPWHTNTPWTTLTRTSTSTAAATTSTSTSSSTTTTISSPTLPSTSTSTSNPSSTPTTPSTTTNTGITLSGIFFDEAPQSSSTSELSYMQEAADYVKSKSTSFAALNTNTSTPAIVFNPGTAPATEYFDYATHIVDFESTYTAWLDQQQEDSSSKTAAAVIEGVDSGDYSQSAIIINSVPQDVDYGAVIDAAVSKGVALVYLTTDFDYKTLESVGKVAAAITEA